MVGVHTLAVRYLTRASWQDQTPEATEANIHLATKLLRTFTAQMEALNRHRGEVGQPMVVGNVNVNEGGQAIVGAVRQDGRGKASTEDDADKSNEPTASARRGWLKNGNPPGDPNTAPRCEAKGSHPRSDASSNGNSLSKPELESLEKALRKRSALELGSTI